MASANNRHIQVEQGNRGDNPALAPPFLHAVRQRLARLPPLKHIKRVVVTAGPYRLYGYAFECEDETATVHLDCYSPLRHSGFELWALDASLLQAEAGLASTGEPGPT